MARDNWFMIRFVYILLTKNRTLVFLHYYIKWNSIESKYLIRTILFYKDIFLDTITFPGSPFISFNHVCNCQRMRDETFYIFYFWICLDLSLFIDLLFLKYIRLLSFNVSPLYSGLFARKFTTIPISSSC